MKPWHQGGLQERNWPGACGVGASVVAESEPGAAAPGFSLPEPEPTGDL